MVGHFSGDTTYGHMEFYCLSKIVYLALLITIQFNVWKGGDWAEDLEFKLRITLYRNIKAVSRIC